jgi:uncharacterized membrane protein YoaK (UPF0700 family)
MIGVSFSSRFGNWFLQQFAEVFMFCDKCGGPVQAGQAFCSKCGKQIIGSVVTMPAARGRVQQHLHLLAILWLAISALNMVGGLMVIVVGNTLFQHLHELGAPSDVPTGFLTSIVTTVGILILAQAACGFLAGYGLLHHEAWARVVTLVLGFIALIHVPFGTALGVYTLWVLLPGESQTEYEGLVAAQPAQAA